MSDNYCMDKDAHIQQLEAENATLKQRIKTLEKRLEELERRLGMNGERGDSSLLNCLMGWRQCGVGGGMR